MYPRPIEHQKLISEQWQSALKDTEQAWKPFAQSLYIDLTEDPDSAKQAIHLEYRLGRNILITHLKALREIGVNHVTFNIKFSKRPVEDVLRELCENYVRTM